MQIVVSTSSPNRP